MNVWFLCAPRGKPFAAEENCPNHQPHELPGLGRFRKGRTEIGSPINAIHAGKASRSSGFQPASSERRLSRRRPEQSAASSPPHINLTRNATITTSMGRDPAVTAIKQLVHAGQLCEGDHRPGPPNLSCQKEYRIRAGDILAPSLVKTCISSERGTRVRGRAGASPIFVCRGEREIRGGEIFDRTVCAEAVHDGQSPSYRIQPRKDGALS